MPHSVSPRDAQDEADELLIQQALELEPGIKADDAIDFEDISDDDLAEDEDLNLETSFSTARAETSFTSHHDVHGSTQDDELAGFMNGDNAEGDGLDDLFGDVPSSPTGLGDGREAEQPNGMDMSFEFDNDGDDLFAEPFGTATEPAPLAQSTKVVALEHNQQRPPQPVAKQSAPSKEQLLQQELFAMSRIGFGNSDYPPAPPENQEELLQSLWPKFERNTVPRFMDLLPPKRARYIGKTPLKVPKPVQPTKVSLELAQDQEKSFRLTASTQARNWQDSEQQGLLVIPPPALSESHSEDEMDVDSDFEGEPVGGVTWEDFKMVCEDWDVQSLGIGTTPDRVHISSFHLCMIPSR